MNIQFKLFAVSLFALVLASCGPSLEDIEAQVDKEMSEDVVIEYNMAVKGGDTMDICVAAGSAALTFQLIHDEANYLKWKEVEKRDCANAGF